jgi:hypothetical protein
VSEHVLGFKNYFKKDWMSENTWKLIGDRKELKAQLNMSKTRQQKARIQTEYTITDRLVKRSVRTDKRMWVDEQAQRAETAAERGDAKELYSITKMLARKGFSKNRPVRSKDGQLLTTEEDQLKRWKEYFSEVLNRDRHDGGVMRENVVETDCKIGINVPTKAEIKLALKQINNGKAPGMDNITSEVLKADIDTTVNLLHPLLEKIWTEEKLPKDWKQGLIVKLPKKGDITNCNNWRGITLMSVPSKVLSRIILNRIKESVEEKLRKEQAGFRKHRSCVDLINTLHIILEQSAEWRSTLHLTFIDSEKAFNSVNRRVMWNTVEEYGIPSKITNIMKEMHEAYECRVLHNGKLTEPIQTNAGVRQGCILSPTLFLLVLDRVMKKVVEGGRRGIQWGIHDRLEDLDYADDICLLSQSFQDMDTKLARLQKEAEIAGLKINIQKTKEMRIRSENETKLTVLGEEVEQVGKDGGAEEDVKNRIRKANGAFVQLYPVWRNKKISRRTNFRLFNSNVKSVLLYSCETWKVTSLQQPEFAANYKCEVAGYNIK